jgi:hypothetical protein
MYAQGYPQALWKKNCVSGELRPGEKPFPDFHEVKVAENAYAG